MSYATRADLETRFGTDEALDLAGMQAGRIDVALADAAAEVDAALAAAYRLRASISHTVAADGRGVEVGSDVPHAAVHQFGGRVGKGRRATLPARPFLGIDDRDRSDIVRILSRALEGAAG